MPDGKRHGRALLLDPESWNFWYELGNLEGAVDSWCCRVVKEADFEEKVQASLYALFGSGVVPLKINFCMHCGKPLEEEPQSKIHYEDCCCMFSSPLEFIEFFDPRTGIIHRLKGNFCFNCGKRIDRASHN